MIYSYQCDGCGGEAVDVVKSAAYSDRPEYCGKCNEPMRRLYSAVHFTTKSVFDKPSYNPAFGKVINSKHQLKDEIRRASDEGKEIVEVGNEKYPDNFAPKPKSYDDDIVDRIKI